MPLTLTCFCRYFESRSQKMPFRFTKGVFQICVAQICQNIGWHAVQTSPMDILIDVLHRYMLELSKGVQSYSNQYGRTEPNLNDVALTFRDFGISLSDIEEYVNNVEPVPFMQRLPSLPLPHHSQLQHPKHGSRDHRLEHIPDYLPLMHPELEEEDGRLSPAFESGLKKNQMDINAAAEGESPSPLDSPKHGTKRPNDWSTDMPIAKKPRHFVEEEGRPMREVTSVFMTPTGFISPAREGKFPDSSLPHTADSPPPIPESNTHASDGTSSKKESKSKDSKRDKSSKSKKDKDLGKKDSKKSKTSKKENKENTASTSSSSKKDHVSLKTSIKSEKSYKSSETNGQKVKEKTKSKESKDEHKKNRDHFKGSKSKSKLKHGSSSVSKSSKSSKVSKSPQKSEVKSPKKASVKSPKQEKKIPVSPPMATVAPIVKKEDLEPNFPKFDFKHESRMESNRDEEVLSDSFDREESPERLVIDISVETQQRQEKESRMALFDECINAVIQRAQEESEMEVEKSHKSVDKTIDSVARGPGVRLEPKDIYEFDDLSEVSSLSSFGGDGLMTLDDDIYRSSDSERSFDSIKKSKVKMKPMRKTKDSKRTSLTSNQKSPNVIVKRAERSPSPIKLKDEIVSSDELDAQSMSPSPTSFLDIPETSSHQRKNQAGPSFSENPSFAPCDVPSTSFSNSPFAPIRSIPCPIQSNPHFPTRPLFQTSKSEQGSMFQQSSSTQPVNLMKSTKSSPEGKVYDSLSTKNTDNDSKSTKFTGDKGSKFKFHRKEKKEKLEKKDKLKKKGKDKKEKLKIEEEIPLDIPKPKERGRPRLNPKNPKKDDKVKLKSAKKKDKDDKDDSSVPRFTLKLTSGNSGTGKFCIKPSAKSPLSSPISPNKPKYSPARVSSLSPSPPPLPLPVSSPVPSPVPSPTPDPDPASIFEFESPLGESAGRGTGRGSHSRGRGRGRKPALTQPTARTVITETLGTMVDEKGNKIWICPACTRVDDGSAMIGCDSCDDWYHWECVGIYSCPETEHWYCSRCLSKRKGAPIKRRRKKGK